MLKEARSMGDSLVVLIARDETVLKIKHKYPKNNEKKRLENIQKLHIADKVILGSKNDKFKVIDEEKPDIIALGYDQKIIVEKLEERLGDNVKIVRLTPFKPEIYKSSKISEALV
jgi:FAD synthetase